MASVNLSRLTGRKKKLCDVEKTAATRSTIKSHSSLVLYSGELPSWKSEVEKENVFCKDFIAGGDGGHPKCVVKSHLRSTLASTMGNRNLRLVFDFFFGISRK